MDWPGGNRLTMVIENLVFTCRLTESRDENEPFTMKLDAVEQIFYSYGVQFNLKKFAAVILRFKDPKIAILIFEEGKIVCTGAKEHNQARTLVYEIVETLKSKGYTQISQSQLETENLVTSTTLPWKIDQKKFHESNTVLCSYDPQQFPGISFRHPSLGRLTMLIFQSGKVVITGAKSMENVRKALNLLYGFVVVCRIIKSPSDECEDSSKMTEIMQSNQSIRIAAENSIPSKKRIVVSPSSSSATTQKKQKNVDEEVIPPIAATMLEHLKIEEIPSILRGQLKNLKM